MLPPPMPGSDPAITTKETVTLGTSALRRPRLVRAAVAAALVALLAALVVASIAFGSRDVQLHDLVAALSGSADGFDQAAVARRIPRTLLALLAGAGLAVSGAVMQGVTRNPVADPGILGVTTGASLAVVIGMAWFTLTTATAFIQVAIVGAGLTAVGVYLIGSLGRDGPTPLKLTLAGAATSAALVSATSAVLLPRTDIADGARSWLIGGVGGGTAESLRAVAPFLAVGFVISLLAAQGLNALALGDELAAGLGQRVAVMRAAAAFGAVILAGAVTAVTGPIAFVGLVIPHVCRLLAGPDHRWLLPLSALGGACLLIAADVLGRIVARPEEIDVGVITALIGAPFFIAIVRRQKVRAL
ncbi:MAG TPA: iron ABC transporter permease [Ruania sp.]|nr:iron ABC transporter permease [Ruania sp.]